MKKLSSPKSYSLRSQSSPLDRGIEDTWGKSNGIAAASAVCQA